MKEENKSQFMQVFKGSLWEARDVEAMLKAKGIETHLKDVLQMNVTVAKSASDVSLLVSENDYVKAAQLVRDRVGVLD